MRFEGIISKSETGTQHRVPFNVPVGTTSVIIKYGYTGREDGNAIDFGVLGTNDEFKGYSGGARFEALIANDEATPGYVPGLLNPGLWHVLLGVYKVAGQSVDYWVEVEFGSEVRSVFEVRGAPIRALGRADENVSSVKVLPGIKRPSRWFKGDMHMHTLYSDGKFTLDELVTLARSRNLDFIFSTEHNTNSANIIWGYHAPSDLLVGRGEEVTTLGGHWGAIGLQPTQLIGPLIEDLTNKDASLVRAVAEVHNMADGFAVINHPFDECQCCEWSYSFNDVMDAIEVWNGPWIKGRNGDVNVKAVAKWDELLREGRIFTATGGSDIHDHSRKIGEPVTRVFAEEASINALIRGLRARRVYLTEQPEFEMELKLCYEDKTASIGDWLEDVPSGRPVRACVKLTGFPNAFEVHVITDQGLVFRTENQNEFQVDIIAKYARIEVKYGTRMMALTNPIWIFTGH